MAIDWIELREAMYPIRTYEDLSKKWRDAISYAFVLGVLKWLGKLEFFRKVQWTVHCRPGNFA